MVRENRIKEQRFTDVNTLTSSATGILTATYSENLNGRLQSINVNAGTAGNGSLFVFESGTDVKLWQVTGFSPSVEAYPRVLLTDNNNTTLTGASGANVYTERVIQGPVYITGSGFGNAKTLSNVSIRYI